jgi:hypothetical protein
LIISSGVAGVNGTGKAEVEWETLWKVDIDAMQVIRSFNVGYVQN